MIKGMYAAASAMVANMARQQILSHNASNMETIGFKQVLNSLGEYMATNVTFSPGDISDTGNLKRVGLMGLGTDMGAEVTDFLNGGIKSTGNMYDFAINGNGFFHIQTPDGDRYTRDGRFVRDAANQLVTAVGGYKVLDANGNPITLPDGDLSVSGQGDMKVAETELGKLALVGFANPREDLARDGDNMFRAVNAPDATVDPGAVEQGVLEMSNVDVASLMSQMILVTRSYEAASKMVVSQDTLLSKTIETLGRF